VNEEKVTESVTEFNEFGVEDIAEKEGEEKEMNDEPLPQLPVGAENWIYSEWDYAQFHYKYTPNWWFNICQRIVLIALNIYKFAGSTETRFYFFNEGKFIANFIIGVLFLVDTLTDDWKLLKGMKAWVRYGAGAAKPENWRTL